MICWPISFASGARENARQRIGGAAGGLRHDEVDRPVGILRGRRRWRRRTRTDSERRAAQDGASLTASRLAACLRPLARRCISARGKGESAYGLVRFRAAAGAGTAAAGGQMDRLRQIQFRRRPQRRRPCSARCAGQGGERRAHARRPRRSRPTASPAARRAIGRCANFWRKSSSAPPASPALPTKSSSPPARCRRSIWSTAFCSIAATPSSSSRRPIRAR